MGGIITPFLRHRVIPKKFLATPPALTQNYSFGGNIHFDCPAFDFLR